MTDWCPVQGCGSRLAGGRWICSRCSKYVPRWTLALLQCAYADHKASLTDDDRTYYMVEWFGLERAAIAQAFYERRWRRYPHLRPDPSPW